MVYDTYMNSEEDLIAIIVVPSKKYLHDTGSLRKITLVIHSPV